MTKVPALTGLERRKEGRHWSFTAGMIGWGSRQFRISCLIKEFSQSGARLVLPASVDLPQELELRLSENPSWDRKRSRWQWNVIEEKVGYRVRVRWRKRRRTFGVQIIGPLG
jgi:hypothetical protein